MSDEPIKVTVLLTPQAYAALERSAEREGLSRTDALNQAVLGFEQLSAASADPTVAFRLPRDAR